MCLRTFNVSSSQCRLQIVLSVLGLLMAAVMGLGPASVKAQDIKPKNPEQLLIFEALNQWMRQNAATFSIDIPGMQDPFIPIKEVRYDQVTCRYPLPPPRPPLLRHDLSAFKLVAVTKLNKDEDYSRALVSFEDGAGASYILRQGSPIGRNNGRIVEITDSTVTVEEPPRGTSKNPVRTTIKLKASPFAP